MLGDTHFCGCWAVALSQALCTSLTPHDSQCGGSAISPTLPIRKMTEVQSHIVCTGWPSHPGLSPEPWPCLGWGAAVCECSGSLRTRRGSTRPGKDKREEGGSGGPSSLLPYSRLLGAPRTPCWPRATRRLTAQSVGQDVALDKLGSSPVCPLTGRVTLGKRVHFFAPHFPRL